MGHSLMLSVASACNRYGVGRSDLLSLLTARKIPALNLKGRTLILRPMADAYFAERTHQAEPEQYSLFD